MTSGDRLSSETSCSCSSTLLHASLAEGKQSNTYPSKQRVRINKERIPLDERVSDFGDSEHS